MSIYKRGAVYWSTVMVNGERHIKSLETSNRRDAERRDHAFKEELHARHFRGAAYRPEMKFGELYARFLAEGDVKFHHKERATQLLPFFCDTPIGEITKNLMVTYRKFRQEEHLNAQTRKVKKPLSDATVNRDISVVRHLLYWALDEGILPHNPLARFRMTRERRKRRIVLTVSREIILLPACVPHLAVLVTLALDTGMRRGEIFSQHWEDIDFERRLLYVTHSKTPEGEMREIPLTTRVFNILKGRQKESGLIFSYNGKPIKTLKTAWRTALRRTKLPHFRFHDLRHTFNSRLVECGVIEAVRKQLMGHSDSSDVHERYTHVQTPLLRDAISRLEAWHEKQWELALSQPNGEDSDPRSNLNAAEPMEDA